MRDDVVRHQVQSLPIMLDRFFYSPQCLERDGKCHVRVREIGLCEQSILAVGDGLVDAADLSQGRGEIVFRLDELWIQSERTLKVVDGIGMVARRGQDDAKIVV